MTTLSIRITGAREAFLPRARWVLETLAEGLGREAVFTDGESDITYAPDPPGSGIWIPMQREAQAFFEGQEAFPGEAVHHAAGLTLLFAPTAQDAPIPGDIVASAFYLLARWDEYRVADRDRFGRKPTTSEITWSEERKRHCLMNSEPNKDLSDAAAIALNRGQGTRMSRGRRAPDDLAVAVMASNLFDDVGFVRCIGAERGNSHRENIVLSPKFTDESERSEKGDDLLG